MSIITYSRVWGSRLNPIDRVMSDLRSGYLKHNTFIKYQSMVDSKFVLGIAQIHRGDPSVCIINKQFKIHFSDIRLANNAGMNMPVCKANAKMLDMDASRLHTEGTELYKNAPDEVIHLFCKRCVQVWNKRYDWCPIVVRKEGL